MLNKIEFAKRLNKIMDYYEISAAGLADSINVQRSSISHLLSGRNKPSLDFVLKILDTYPEISFGWLVMGEGNFTSSAIDEKNIDPTPTLFSKIPEQENKSKTKFATSKKKKVPTATLR